MQIQQSTPTKIHYFQTKIEKPTFGGPKKICLGCDSTGKEVWVKVTKDKPHQDLSVVCNPGYLELNFEIRKKNKTVHKTQNIAIQELIDNKIPCVVFDDFSNEQTSIVFDLYRFYHKNEKLIKESFFQKMNCEAFTRLFFSSKTINKGGPFKLDENPSAIINQLALIRVYRELIPYGANSQTEQSFLELIPSSRLNDWQRLTPILSNPELVFTLKVSSIETQDLISYFQFFPEDISPFIAKIEEIQKASNLPSEQVNRKLVQFTDKLLSFVGLCAFYYKVIKDCYTNWTKPQFLCYMRYADMTERKLKTLQQENKLGEFLSTVKEDYADFETMRSQGIKEVSFPYYLRYIAAFPGDFLREPGFRSQMKAYLNKPELAEFIKSTTEKWVNLEYEKYQYTGIDTLFTINNGLRWKKEECEKEKNKTVWKQVTDLHPMTKERFIKIVSFCKNEINKGNLCVVTRLFKEDTGLGRTVVINPRTERISILLKSKGVPKPKSTGTYKSVTMRVVIESNDEAQICAELTQPICDEWTKDQWRRMYSAEFNVLNLFKGNSVFDVHEYVSRSSGKLTVSAGQEWLDLPNLHYTTTADFPLKVRLQLFIEVLRDLRLLHQADYVHGDIKPDNMGAKRVYGKYKGVLTDFGFTRKIGTLSSPGTHQYLSPEFCRESLQTKGMCNKTPQGDLWAFGLSLFEILMTKPKQKGRPRPEFFIKAVKEASDLCTCSKDKGITTDSAFFQCLSVVTKNDIDNSIDETSIVDFEGSPIATVEEKGLKEVFKSLLDPSSGSKKLPDHLRQEALVLEDNIIKKLEAIYLNM